MATVKERYEVERFEFQEALEGRFVVDGAVLELTKPQAEFVRNAIPSIDYVLRFLRGEVTLPKEDEEITSHSGSFGFLTGSFLNIAMAENIVYGRWGNVNALYEVEGYNNNQVSGYEERIQYNLPGCDRYVDTENQMYDFGCGNDLSTTYDEKDCSSDSSERAESSTKQEDDVEDFLESYMSLLA